MIDGDEAEFRVWAPRANTIALWLRGREIELTDAGYGVYETVAAARPGDDYEYLVDGQRRPDPGSRWQPQGLSAGTVADRQRRPPLERL